MPLFLFRFFVVCLPHGPGSIWLTGCKQPHLDVHVSESKPFFKKQTERISQEKLARHG